MKQKNSLFPQEDDIP